MENLSSHIQFALTVVYAANDPAMRNDLWLDLASIAATTSLSWVVSGDFNNPLFLKDRIGSLVSRDSS